MSSYEKRKGMEEMFHLIKKESKKMFLPVLLTSAVLAGIMCVLTEMLYLSYTLHYDLEAWEVGTGGFSLFYPLFVVIPLCWNLYYERKNNFLLYIAPRVPVKKYLAAKWAAYALGAFCIMTVPYLLAAVYAIYIKAPVVPPETNTFSHVFQTAFVERPLLYAAVLSCWRGGIGILVMTFGFVLAMYCKNIFVILTGPFIYSILENFIMSILGWEKYRLVVAFDPTCISSQAVTALSFFAGPALLLFVIGFTAFFLSKIRKKAVMDV